MLEMGKVTFQHFPIYKGLYLPIWMDATVFYNVFIRIWKGKSAKYPKVINLSFFLLISATELTTG